MLVYAFAAECERPRTMFTDVPAAVCEQGEAEPASGWVTPLQNAILRVLHGFPEAYRAVLDEMRRLEGSRETDP